MNLNDWRRSWAAPSIHMDEPGDQESGKGSQFFLCCSDEATKIDHFAQPSRRLYATSSTTTSSISNLIHPILNSKETRMPIFREQFKQTVLYALVEVAVLLCGTAEPCQWCPSIDNSDGSVHSTWTYMLNTEIPNFPWQDGTAKFGKTEALLLLVQELSEHLLVPKHHTVEDLVSNQTVINACRCIAKSLEALPNHDFKRVLGVCGVAQDIFCSITRRENLRLASSLTDDVSVIEQTQYADESNTQSLFSGGTYAGPTTPLVNELRLAAYNDNATHENVGQSSEPQKLNVWLTQEPRGVQPCYTLPATSRSGQNLTW
jgi:hypothetical protein